MPGCGWPSEKKLLLVLLVHKHGSNDWGLVARGLKNQLIKRHGDATLTITAQVIYGK